MPLMFRIAPWWLLPVTLAAVLGGAAAFMWGRAQAAVEAAPSGAAVGAAWSGTIFLRNDGTGPATAVVNFYSTAGVLVHSYSVPGPIPAKGTASIDTEAIAALPAGFAGSAVVSSNQPVNATLVASDPTNPAVNQTLYNGFSAGANTAYVPSISNNYADQTSTLAVQNIDPVPAAVTIRYIERFTGAQTAVVSDTIPANSSHFYDSGNLPGGQQLPPPWTGAALINSAGGKVVAAVHQPYLTSNKAVAFEGTAAVGAQSFLPSALYQYGPQGQTSFISAQNTQSTPVDMEVTFYGTDGRTAGVANGRVQGFQKQSWNPGSAGIGPGFLGSAVARASGPIAVIVEIMSATDLSMAYTGQIEGTPKQVLPYVRWAPSIDPRGWRTFVAVMNVDQSAAADITIKYYDQNGTLVQAPSFRGVAPNTKVNHHPGLFVGDNPFVGSIEIEANRPVLGLVNAITVSETQAESYTSLPSQ